MNEDPNSLDRLARRLIQSSDQDLRRFLGVSRLDPALVSLLYMHVRGVIEESDGEGTADELALAIYLTASAWQSNVAPPVDLLTSLHAVIQTTLDAERNERAFFRSTGALPSRKEPS